MPSWSSIDYYGRWKALQFCARRFDAPILVSPHVEDGSLKVYIVSDKTENKTATLRVRLMDFDGKVFLEDSHPVDVTALASSLSGLAAQEVDQCGRGRPFPRVC